MQNLNGDPIPWLLNPEYPIRPLLDAWLIFLTDRQMTLKYKKPEPRSFGQPLAKELFSLQHVKGYWGEENQTA